MVKTVAIKKRLSAVERKGQIVGVAMSLFAQKGFKGTTTREIAERAGISEAVIFRHFNDKDALYDAIINARCTDVQGEPRLLARIKGKEGREIFRAIASFLIAEHRQDDSFLRLLIYSALEGHELSERFINTRGLEFLEYLKRHIKALMEKGVFRKTDPEIAARAFMGMVIYYSISQEIFGLKKFFTRPDAEVVDTFVDIFFDGMLDKN
ncbi:MAG: TetR/AcrR family transcriptional regulator [Deltaproteobacteria bacterium]|nr:TetR/AcrR family transcriptional regulator [Deltaproteobacteria bacterium]